MDAPVARSSWSLRRALLPGVQAVKSFWPPLLAIQLVALGLVVAYYRLPSVAAFAAELAEIKRQGGVPFAFLVGGTAGGLVPEVAKLVTGKIGRLDRQWLGEMLYNALCYGTVGVEVSLFYGLQTHLFGDLHDARTLVVKTSVDMFIFSPTISIPTATLFYALRKNRFRLASVAPNGPGRFYVAEILPSLILCWAFWIPVLLCTYSLPGDLQFCFSNLAEAAWSILFVFIATQPAATEHVADPAPI